MKHSITLSTLEFVELPVTEKTIWQIAEIGDSDGVSTIVEISLAGTFRSRNVYTEFAQLFSVLQGVAITDEAEIPTLAGITNVDLQRDFKLATVVSGLRSSVEQIQSIHQGISLTEILGGSQIDSVPLYANINRSLVTDRSKEAFATAAEEAVTRGFCVIKCAPFDEVDPSMSFTEILRSSVFGIDRVAAIRKSIGKDIDILVDCHSRFEEYSAPLIGDQLAEFDVGWFEEPLDPDTDGEKLVKIGASISIPLAGGERLYGSHLLTSLVANEVVQIAMPDVKHCGGVKEAVIAGRSVIAAGGKYSLHSPSGPVSLLASAHATAAVEGASPLEHAVNETDWRFEVLEPAERIENGRLWFTDRIGIGALLHTDLVNRLGSRWKP